MRGVNVSGWRRNIKVCCLLSKRCRLPLAELQREEKKRLIRSSSNVHPRLSRSRSDLTNQRLVFSDVLFIFYETSLPKLFKCIDSVCIACPFTVHSCRAALSINVHKHLSNVC